ncbi:MAG TPA: hypothetical protein EYM37_06610 [Methylophaga aminisulfidivorans]|uniref:hypothetical protein n=1 Tax=Methylophaga TaxID=40222 RepID=UPI00175FFD67|nr:MULTISPECIES: hypothetical protein [Methylophaga]HIC47012.1 hypothetical protein [Methylophaga sp.]HIM39597.1 hypothetical protein [Methylophaga aminisulfidivorans]
MLDYLFKIIQLDQLREWIEDKRFAKRAGLRSTARRVLQVFDKHNIPVTRIPQIFPQFNLHFSDFDSLDSLVKKLNTELLETISKHFFINYDWLETGKGPIQQVFETGYDFEAIYDFIVNYQDSNDTSMIAYFVAQKGIKFVPAYDHGSDEHVAVILEIIHGEGEKLGVKYSRYLPLYMGYSHYYKTRMMLKSISLLLFQAQKSIHQKGLFSKHLDYEYFDNEFASSLTNSSHWEWHPDDYIFCNGQSAQEKDPIDAKRMQEYLKEIGFYTKLKTLRSTEFLS